MRPTAARFRRSPATRASGLEVLCFEGVQVLPVPALLVNQSETVCRATPFRTPDSETKPRYFRRLPRRLLRLVAGDAGLGGQCCRCLSSVLVMGRKTFPRNQGRVFLLPPSAFLPAFASRLHPLSRLLCQDGLGGHLLAC
jgi:hypothetical protein